MNYLMWIMVGFTFSKVIRSRFRGWWLQYNYILSAALDAGLALCTIFIFLTLQLTKVDPPKWWGNNVVSSTLVRASYLSLEVATNVLAGPTRKSGEKGSCGRTDLWTTIRLVVVLLCSTGYGNFWAITLIRTRVQRPFVVNPSLFLDLSLVPSKTTPIVNYNHIDNRIILGDQISERTINLTP
jgi:hypothetical protein